MHPAVWIAGLLAGAAVGGMLYTTLLTAPIVFVVLDRSEAHRFTRRLWPRYFLINAVFGLTVGLLLGLPARPMATSVYAALAAGGLMGINYLLTWPIGWFRGGEGAGEAADPGVVFGWLHRTTVWFNWASLGLMGWVLFRILRV